jgi:DNA-binding PadR family transcriptional regulator
VTDRNLASHLKNLEKQEYIAVSKSFLGRKPLTNYSATESGKKAFKDHLEFLENLINDNKH